PYHNAPVAHYWQWLTILLLLAALACCGRSGDEPAPATQPTNGEKANPVANSANVGSGPQIYLVTGANSQLASLDLPQMTLDLAHLIHPELTDLPVSAADLPMDEPGSPDSATLTKNAVTIAAGGARPRLVSGVPAGTLLLVQLGAVKDLVGVSTYDKLVLPEEQRDLPVVGDYMNLNFETLLAQRPTALVIQFADERLSPRLKEVADENKITIVNIRLDSIEDVYTTARKLGGVAQRSRTAEYEIARVKGQLAAIGRRTAKVPKKKVIYVIGKSPIWIVGSERFLDEMITLAGGENLGRKVGRDFPQITGETLVTLAPEVLLIAAPGEPAPRQLNDPTDPRIAAWLDLDIPAAARRGSPGGGH
ncbi:MAG: ABC transporter substrate-binding protein, partial [Phycisphaerae bacterium]